MRVYVSVYRYSEVIDMSKSDDPVFTVNKYYSLVPLLLRETQDADVYLYGLV